jgi:hypothetical protein
MNNIVVKTTVDNNLFSQLCNELHNCGYKVFYVGFNKQNGDEIHCPKIFYGTENGLLEDQENIKKFLLEEKYEFVFVRHFNNSINRLFKEITCSELFYSLYIYHDNLIENYDISNFNIIDSNIINANQYVRDMKIKTLLKNE